MCCKNLILLFFLFFLSCEKKLDKHAEVQTKSKSRVEEKARNESAEKQEAQDLKEALRTSDSTKDEVVTKADIDAFMAGIDELTDEELVAFMNEESVLRDMLLSDGEQLNSLFARLAKHDPELALNYLSLINSLQRAYVIDPIFEEWVKIDLEVALQRSRELENAAHKNTALVTVLAHIVEDNPKRAIKLSDELIWDAASGMYSRGFLVMLAYHHPELALEFFSELDMPPSYTREEISDSVYKRAFGMLGKKDFARALELLNLETNQGIRVLAIEGIVRMKRKDDEAMQTLLDALEDETEIAKVREIQNEKRKRWRVDSNYAQAAHEFLDQGFQGVDSNLVKSAFNGFANEDLTGFTDFIPKIKDEENKKSAYGAMLNAWSKDKPHEAFDYYIQNYDKGGIDAKALIDGNGFLVNIAKTMPKESLDQLLSLPSSNEGNDMLTSAIMTYWYVMDHDEANNYISGLDADVETTKTTYKSIGSVYGGSGHAEGLKWLAEIENQGLRNEATGGFASSGMIMNPDGTMDWVDTLPVGTERDYAVKEVSAWLAKSDKELAAEWANTISDQEMRNEVLTEVEKLQEKE